MTTLKVFIQVRDFAKKEIWSTNGLCGSNRNQTIPILPMKMATGKSYPYFLEKGILTGKILYVYIYGFLTDLGQFHYYSSAPQIP